MDEAVTDTLEWKTASKVRYPNITVCNKRYFALHRLKSKSTNPCKVTCHLRVLYSVAINLGSSL